MVNGVTRPAGDGEKRTPSSGLPFRYPADVRGSLDEQTEELLLRRMRLGSLLIFGSYMLFFAHDLLVGQPRLGLLIAIKVVQTAYVVGLLLLLQHPRAAHHAVCIAVGSGLFMAFTATLSAIARSDTSGHLLVLLGITVVAAALFPWGARAQAILVAGCLLLLAWDFHAVAGSVAMMATDPAIAGLVTAAAVSLYIARDGERYRREIGARELGLRRSEEHFRSLIENGGDLILVLDLDGRVRSASASLEPLLGYEVERWVGGSIFTYVHDDDREALRQVLASAASAASPVSIEVRVRDANAGWHVLLGTVTNFAGDPAVRGIVLSARDISQRKEMEVELRRSEASLSALFDSAPDSVWSIDRESRLTAINGVVRDLFAENFGHDLRVGQSLEERSPGDLTSVWTSLYARALAGEKVTAEQSFEHDGVTRHYQFSMNPIREGDEISGAVIISRDITDLRQTAELARRNQADLTHVLRLGTMGEIAASLAHEINQPLGAIANYAAACGRWLDSGAVTPLELRRGLAQISGEALRAGEIIRRLRALSRKGQESMEMVDANSVVQSALALMRPETRLQGITLQLEAATDLPPVYVDPIEIEQVLLNLVLNAIEAMQASAVKNLTVRTELVDDRVRIAVCDSGSGLDADLAEVVFDPFFTTKAKGLGMGLAISRRIVEAHGGLLTGAANDSGGSTFAFTLPVRTEPRPLGFTTKNEDS